MQAADLHVGLLHPMIQKLPGPVSSDCWMTRGSPSSLRWAF